MTRITIYLIALLLLAACTGQTGSSATTTGSDSGAVAAESDHHADGDDHHADGHSHEEESESVADDNDLAEAGSGMHDDAAHGVDGTTHDEMADDHAHGDMGELAEAHGIPAEAALVSNPSPPTEETISLGAAAFATNCASCHGPLGAGDGPAAVALNPAPADLRASHVQSLSDGALFYVITEGREGTAMPAWESVLEEESRWAIVRFLRTLPGQK